MSPPLLILAGGLGTRLREVVSDLPKPLAPVDGKPFLAYLIDNWHAQGVREFIFLLNYKYELIQDFLTMKFKEDHLSDCSYKTVVEPELLGTGGAVAHALKELKITQDVLIANADTWLEHGITDLSESEGNTICVRYVDNAERYGSVKIKDGQIEKFVEKSESKGGSYINAGLYRLSYKEFLNWDGKPMSMEEVILPAAAQRGELLAVVIDCCFIDIGVAHDYYHFCQWVTTKK